MKKLRFLSITAFIALILLGCQKTKIPVKSGNGSPLELTQKQAEVVNASTEFSFHIFNRLHKSAPSENIFISPLSIHIALGMLYNGSDSDTRDSIQSVLEMDGLAQDDINDTYFQLIDQLPQLDPQVNLDIANSIWYRDTYSVESSFLQVNKNYFKSKVAALDFTSPNSVNIINNWVKQVTNGTIDQVINDIKPEHVLFLINAIYFKGDWTHTFDKQKTTPEDFYLENGQTETVQMMQKERSYPYYFNQNFEAIELPYADSIFSMLLISPNHPYTIQDLAGSFDRSMYMDLINGLSYQKVQLALPRFEMEYKQELEEVLTQMGMGVVFDHNKADLSKIGPGKLEVTNVTHKTYVKVNEEGTEASAVTSIGIGITSAPPMVRLDHPFLFLIRENESNTILFMGKMMNP